MTITGIYKTTKFRNTETGYTIFNLSLTCLVEGYDYINLTCKGTIDTNLAGLPLMLTGELATDESGTYFFFTEVEPHINDKEEALDLIDSACFPGISKELGNRIIEKLGYNLFEIAKKDNPFELLCSVPGIGASRAEVVLNTIKKFKSSQDTVDFVKQYGGSFLSAEYLINTYGLDAVDRLKESPYKIGKKAKLPFNICDMIARDAGFPFDDTGRIDSLIYEVLERAYQSGNTCLSLERIIKGIIYTVVHVSAFQNNIIPEVTILSRLSALNDVVSEFSDDTVYFYLKFVYDNEKNLSDNIKRINAGKRKYDVDIEKLIDKCERDLKIKYSSRQKDCFNLLKTSGIKIVTGGPGTGKSTVINGLIHAFEEIKENPKIVMMAPTGRAAQRIKEITGKEAGTIHLMLNIVPRVDRYLTCDYFADYDADMVIIDESSMLDTEIANQVMQAIKNNTTVIMVGDIDQLPSVGAGNILHDLINSKLIDYVLLNVNYRQGDKSTIVSNAEKINRGETDLICDDSFSLIKCKNDDDLAAKSTKLLESLNRKYGFNKVQMLTSVKGGKAGVFKLNKAIQEKVNINKVLAANKFNNFKTNDKIMVTVNNYNTGCFNGDVGTVHSVDDENINLIINETIIKYPKENIDELQLAYAMTIHKSQGSEYDYVVICLPEEPKTMLRRNLIYTAVTRAKKKAFIFYTGDALNKSINTNTDHQRNTGLINKLKKAG